jgi:hypothetical protein
LGWNVVNGYVVVGIGVMIGVMMLAVQKDQHDFLFSSFLNLIAPRLRTTAPTVIPPSQLIDEHLPRHLVGRIQRQCMLQCLTCIVGRWERVIAGGK